MGGIDVVIGFVILAILGGSGFAVYKSKKSGKKCIGCPDSCACSSGNCAGGCGGCSTCKK